LLGAQPVSAQSIEERVASLELQVAELWQLRDRANTPGVTVPAELVGNEHLRWGYPGGDCAVLVNVIEPRTFIGLNHVAVPTHFYKVILKDNNAAGFEMFAFVMADQIEPLDGEVGDYLVSVDLVEVLSGLDFFSALPDLIEEDLEEEVVTTWPQLKGINRWN
jgi:DNA/RNA endonuclease G (NUC1)